VADQSFQVLENTQIACDIMARTVQKLHSASEQGTIVRMWDACPVFTALVVVCAIVAVALCACLVALAMHDRKLDRVRNTPYVAVRATQRVTLTYVKAPTTVVDANETRNMRACA
jgi:hypothetical protein